MIDDIAVADRIKKDMFMHISHLISIPTSCWSFSTADTSILLYGDFGKGLAMDCMDTGDCTGRVQMVDAAGYEAVDRWLK